MNNTKEEMIKCICDHIRSMEDGTVSTFSKIVAAVCGDNDSEMDLFDMYHEVRDRLEYEIDFDSGEYTDSIVGLPYNIPFIIRKKSSK